MYPKNPGIGRRRLGDRLHHEVRAVPDVRVRAMSTDPAATASSSPGPSGVASRSERFPASVPASPLPTEAKVR